MIEARASAAFTADRLLLFGATGDLAQRYLFPSLLHLLRDRLLPTARRLVDRHPETDVVLVGHGTAWTLLVSELSGTAPDLERCRHRVARGRRPGALAEFLVRGAQIVERVRHQRVLR